MPEKSPSAERILTYYQDELKLLDEHLGMARDTFDHEAIHQYRLAMKRIKALFNLLEYVTEGKLDSATLHRPFRKYFKAGGELRDTHVHLELMDGYETRLNQKFYSIKEQLLMDEISQQWKFSKKTRSGMGNSIQSPAVSIASELDGIAPQMFLQRAGRWVKSELDFLRGTFPFIYDPELFHSFRRHQKEVFYVIDVLNNYLEARIETALPADEVKLIARKIGTWHDHHNLFGRVRTMNEMVNDSRLRISRECQRLAGLIASDQADLFHELRQVLSDPAFYELAPTLSPSTEN